MSVFNNFNGRAGHTMLIIPLVGFTGGTFEVSATWTPQTNYTSRVAAGPGKVVFSGIFQGPKEWSPLGLIPKGWDLLFKVPTNTWITLMVDWTDDDMKSHLVMRDLNSELPGAFYFVPEPQPQESSS